MLNEIKEYIVNLAHGVTYYFTNNDKSKGASIKHRNSKYPGMFITVEGIDGSGKTTQIKHIEEYLVSHSIEHFATREPGGTKLGERIRDTLLRNAVSSMHSKTELLLMFAARNEHVTNMISPMLKLGYCIVCDRFTDSTYAYQGGGRLIDVANIATLETLVHDGLVPDVTIYIDVPVELALSRVGNRDSDDTADRIEQEDIDFFNRVRQSYLAMAELNPNTYYVIDGSKSINNVTDQIHVVLDGVFKKDLLNKNEV